VEQDVKLGSTRSVWKRDVSWGVIESLGVEICRKARDCPVVQLLLLSDTYLHKLIPRQTTCDDCHREAPKESGGIAGGTVKQHWPESSPLTPPEKSLNHCEDEWLSGEDCSYTSLRAPSCEMLASADMAWSSSSVYGLVDNC
jgi:hypothetical protein